MTAVTAVAVVADVAVNTAVIAAGLNVTVIRTFLCSLCCTAAEAGCCGHDARIAYEYWGLPC